MNKQELIERIEGLKNVFGNKTKYVEKNTVIELISELDEPQKVVVPQFVAEWYEENKANLEYNIWEYIYNWDRQNVPQIKRWFDYSSNKPFQTLINMKQFGYEVEKEPKYIVKLKGTGANFSFLNLNKAHNHWMFSSKNECDIYQVHHTRKQLEDANFGWVFDCPGIEVEEVE